MKRLKCWLFGCAGYACHETDADGIVWIGLRCATCGKLTERTRSCVQTNPDSIYPIYRKDDE